MKVKKGRRAAPPPPKPASYSGEEASTSSEDEPEWTKEHEAAFLKTLGALKTNTEEIYDDDVKFWDKAKVDEKTNGNGKTKKTKHEPMFLKDYERKVILEKEGKFEDSDEGEDEEKSKEPGYYEQQEQIRKKLKATIAEVSDDDDDLLVKRTKCRKEEEAEEEDYYDWLKKQDQDQELPAKTELAGLKKAWNAPDLNEDDKFLRDYLLNKDYVTDDKKEGVPAYADIVDLDEDDEEFEKNRQYEAKYNFRYEEPDQNFIKQYPRSVTESLREGNKKRKEKREQYKTRKAEEKETAKKEIAQQKLSAKKHIEAKLRALREVVGEDIPLKLEDLEEDFDPKKFDERMKDLFEKKYYEGEEQLDGEEEMEKPVFSDMSEEEGDEEEDYDDEEAEDVKIEVQSDEDDDSEEESDDEPAAKKSKMAEEEQGRKRKESRRKRKRLADTSRAKKPVFDPSEKTFQEYLDEYYSFDYEDIIGDQRTKFKYRQVVANNFGLDAAEILNADDRQLNQWVSLRKVTSYRADQDENFDVKAYQQKATNEVKKRKIFSSDLKVESLLKKKQPKEEIKAEAAESEQTGQEKAKKKRNKKKKAAVEVKKDPIPEPDVPKVEKTARRRKKKPAASAAQNGTTGEQKETVKAEGGDDKKPQKRKLEKKKGKKSHGAKVDDNRLLAYGINPKKYRAGLKYGQKKKKETA